MSDDFVWLALEKCQTYRSVVRLEGKTTLDATYYSEPRKMNNLDTTLIGTALLANKGLMLSKT